MAPDGPPINWDDSGGATPIATAPVRLGGFVKSEIKGLFVAFFKPFCKFTLLVWVSLLLILIPRLFMAEPAGGPNVQQPPLPVKIAVLGGFSLFYALNIGLIAGGISVMLRMVGIWMIFPMVLIPAAIALSVWLCSDWLIKDARNAAMALDESARKHKFPATQKAAEGIVKGLGHAGTGALALVGLFLAPFIVLDAVPILLDPLFLGPFAWFLGVVALVVGFGLVPASLVSLVVLSFAVVKRMRLRYRDYARGFKDVVRADG